jgi:uncharacterized membrane protein
MPSSSFPAEVHFLRRLVLILFYGLWLVLFFNSLTLTTGLSVTTFVIWAFAVFPLALFTPFLHRAGIRAYAWLSFVVLMYFVHGVLTAFTPGKLLVGILETACCCLLFATLIALIRKYRQVTGASL